LLLGFEDLLDPSKAFPTGSGFANEFGGRSALVGVSFETLERIEEHTL